MTGTRYKEWLSKHSPSPTSKSQYNGIKWPKISIVTPSFNQANFIEETIQSVLQQEYPNLEYIIIDGGSTDGSLEIIKRYAPLLTYWVSERDRGQSHAILKGFAHSTGEIMAWINSDDLYAPGALLEVAKMALRKPQALWFAGRCDFLEDGMIDPGWRWHGNGIEQWYMHTAVMQPGVFWRRELWQERGGLDENLHYSFDYELWLRFSSLQTFPYWTNTPLAFFRSHSSSKTTVNPELFDKEDEFIRKKYTHIWEMEPTKTRLNRLLRRREANNFIHIASKIDPFFLRILFVSLGISFSPLILFNPKCWLKIFAAISKYHRQ